ncbi:MAG: tetratricopeptide repeat protein [bacterium]
MPHQTRQVWLTILLLSYAGGCGIFKAEDPEVLYEQALANVEAEKFTEARAQLDRLKKLRPMTVLDHGLQSRIDMAAGRCAEALAELAAIPDDHALAGWARLRRGQLYRQMFDFRRAETELRAAIRLDSASVPARRELVYILGLQLRRAELNQIFLELSRLTTLSPKEVWVWCMVRDLVWWVPEEQIPILQKAIEADPDDVFSRLALAEVLQRNSRVDDANQELALLPPDLPEALAKRLEIQIEKDGPENAGGLLGKIPENHPSASLIRGRLALGLGNAPEAIRQFEIADKSDPGRRQVLADLGRALGLAGDLAKARDFAQKAGRVDELNNMLLKSENTVEKSGPAEWKEFARACEKAGRLNESRAWLALLIQKNPLEESAQAEIYRIDQLLKEGPAK